MSLPFGLGLERRRGTKSLHNHTAVDHDQLAGHAIRFRTRKECGCSYDIIRVRVTLHEDHVFREPVHRLAFFLEFADRHQIFIELLP